MIKKIENSLPQFPTYQNKTYMQMDNVPNDLIIFPWQAHHYHSRIAWRTRIQMSIQVGASVWSRARRRSPSPISVTEGRCAFFFFFRSFFLLVVSGNSLFFVFVYYFPFICQNKIVFCLVFLFSFIISFFKPSLFDNNFLKQFSFLIFSIDIKFSFFIFYIW